MLAESLPNAPAAAFATTFTAVENALLPFVRSEERRIRNFGIMLEPRYIVGTEPLDQ